MKSTTLKILLFPFSLLYGLVILVRNWLFDSEVLPSKSFKTPIISIGNLSVGGTGKTPHTEYLLSLFQDEWKTAVLSRGYKRKTKGFKLANENADSKLIGDEPFQIFQKFPKVTVAVDEKRVRGVEKLLQNDPEIQLIILDDAFQHRHIHPGFSILLTDYNRLYSKDWLLPSGRLREPISGSRRADCIIVTKCPSDIKPIEMRIIASELKLETNQTLFFSCPEYQPIKPVFPELIFKNISLEDIQNENTSVLLVTGIVSPEPIVEYLSGFSKNLKTIFFPDHYAFLPTYFDRINKELDSFTTSDKILLVTEKDAARIISNPLFPDRLKGITYTLPIQVKILNNQEEIFTQKIKDYVIENSRNS